MNIKREIFQKKQSKKIMKNIQYTTLASLLLWLASLPSFAQSTLQVSSGANLYISGNTFFTVDSLVLNPSADFIITGVNSETRNATITHSSINPSIRRAFLFLTTVPSFTGSISIYYRDDELNGLPENTLTLNIHDGVKWNDYIANVTRDEINNVVTTAGLNNINLNELTLANAGAPLPVLFTLLNSLCVGTGVKISWKTAQELNSKYFDIETSSDAIHWSIAGSVNAAGTSNTEQNYSFTDNRFLNVFYRIVEYDIDGKSIISSVIPSSCSIKEGLTFHPNPVYDKAIVSININAAATAIFKLYDTKGALMKTTKSHLEKGFNHVEINMAGLASGIYTLTARWNNQTQVNKIVKE